MKPKTFLGSYYSERSNSMIDHHKFRDCSIYDKNLSLQIMKEQMFRDREIQLRKYTFPFL